MLGVLLVGRWVDKAGSRGRFFFFWSFVVVIYDTPGFVTWETLLSSL